MNGNFDKAGIFFAVLAIVAAIPLALDVLRRRGPDDPVSRFACRTIVAAAITNGVVNVLRNMGLMTDDPTYQTLVIASLVLWAVMFWIFLRQSRRRAKGDIPA